MPAVLSGVTQDLLDNAEDTDTSKILNGLDFPLWDGIRDRSVYATDMAAWDVTRGLHIFDPSTLYPAGDVRWGLAGLKNAMTFVHIDPEGFHTENTIGVGGKAWGILRERPDFKASSTNFYLDDGFRLNEVKDCTKYDYEIIALRPGDRMYVYSSIILAQHSADDFSQLHATQYPPFCVWDGEHHLLRRSFLLHLDNATDALRGYPLIYAGQVLDQYQPSSFSPAFAADSYVLSARSDG